MKPTTDLPERIETMTETAELQRHEPIEVERPRSEVGSLIHLAIEKGMDADKLDKLFELYERDTARRAKEEFYADLARFQADCPAIKKTGKSMQFKRASRDGGGSEPSEFLELDYICDTIRPHLHKYGFSYTWDKDPTATKDGMMGTVCYVRHRNGHVESSSFPCPIGSNAGASDQQKYAAAATYAKRYSLIAALGLTGTSRDTDGVEPNVMAGNGSHEEPPRYGGPLSLDGYVTPEQVTNLAKLIADTGTQPERFLKAYSIAQLSDLRSQDYAGALVFFRRKAEAAKKGVTS